MKMATVQAWDAHAKTIVAAQAGDAAALEALLVIIWPHAYRIALSILHQTQAAEDAAQEACARIMLSIAQLRSHRAFSVWLYRIVVREALALERRTHVHEPLDPRAVASASSLTDAEVRLDVLRALHELPPQQRSVVALHAYADLNSREIATVLEMPEGTVRYHLALARRRLERLLAVGYAHSFAEVLFDAL